MEQPTVVSVDRWSLYRGALVSLRWPTEQPTVVSVDRWSLYRGALVCKKPPSNCMYNEINVHIHISTHAVYIQVMA